MSHLILDQQLSYSLRRQYVDEFLTRRITPDKIGQTLVDVGGVKEQHRGDFNLVNTSMQVVAVNLSASKGTDVRAIGSMLPLVSNRFDWALCSEVLEHVKDPLSVLVEIFRVLRPGGTVVLTVPFLFRLHPDPADIGRYTHWFWQEELTAIGFNEIKIEKQGLFQAVIVDMLREWMRFRLTERRLRVGRWLFPRIIRRLRNAALRFDAKPENQEHSFWGQYTSGYGISAVKPI